MDRNLLEMMSVQQSIARMVGTGAWGLNWGDWAVAASRSVRGRDFFAGK